MSAPATPAGPVVLWHDGPNVNLGEWTDSQPYVGAPEYRALPAADFDAREAERVALRDLAHLLYDLVAESIGTPQYDFKSRAALAVERASTALRGKA